MSTMQRTPTAHSRETGAQASSAMPTDPMLDHEYDGIREYDNPTPGWWHIIFIATVIFSAGYLVFWHYSPISWTIQQALEDDKRVEYARLFGSVGELKADEETILKYRGDERFMAVAGAMFAGNCAQCHAKDGGGLSASGVNLCDDNYKNIKTVGDLFTVISEGANNGAMPAQKARLSQNERVLLAAYVATLRGTTPAAAKAPEGDIIPPFPPIVKIKPEPKPEAKP